MALRHVGFILKNLSYCSVRSRHFAPCAALTEEFACLGESCSVAFTSDRGLVMPQAIEYAREQLPLSKGELGVRFFGVRFFGCSFRHFPLFFVKNFFRDAV